MTPEQREKRRLELLEKEICDSNARKTWWWLSFADPHKPKGTQFLGAVLVDAYGFLSAVEAARSRNLNPGGEVMGYRLDGEPPSKFPRWTLMTREEIEAFWPVVTG